MCVLSARVCFSRGMAESQKSFESCGREFYQNEGLTQPKVALDTTEVSNSENARLFEGAVELETKIAFKHTCGFHWSNIADHHCKA